MCGLTCETMNCETWKSCESRCSGRSARREPSTYLVPAVRAVDMSWTPPRGAGFSSHARAPGGSIGTMRPRLSFAIRVAGRMMPGSAHEAATAE